MSLLGTFEWLEMSAIGSAVRDSPWMFPVIEAVHLLGLALIGGAVLVVDLRLLGLGLRRQPVSDLAHDAQGWFLGSLVVMLMSGIPLFLSEAVKCYYSAAFWIKIVSLAAAVVFALTIRRRVTVGDPRVAGT